jgi:malonyl-CoA/methylmalonyl-CoA synthetase
MVSVVTDPADWVEEAARNQPQRLFLTSPAGRRYSYAALREESGRFASALMARGVVPGDRVAVQVEKSAEAVLLYIACLRMGAVFVPINVANTPNEVDYFLCDSRPRLAVIRPADRELLAPVAARAGIRHLETLGSDGEGSFLELVLNSDRLCEPWQRAAANSLAAIIYTSGTTGRSKGAMLTRANLASNAAGLVEAWRFTAHDVLLHALTSTDSLRPSILCWPRRRVCCCCRNSMPQSPCGICRRPRSSWAFQRTTRVCCSSLA